MSALRLLSFACLVALSPYCSASEKDPAQADKVIVLTVDAKGRAGIGGVLLATPDELKLHLMRLFETERRAAKSPAELKRLLIHVQPDDAATYEAVWATLDGCNRCRVERLKLQLGKNLTKTLTLTPPEVLPPQPAKDNPPVVPVDEPPTVYEVIVLALRADMEGPKAGQLRSVAVRLVEEAEFTTLPAADWQAALRKKLEQLRQSARKDVAVKLAPEAALRWAAVVEAATLVDKVGYKTIHFVAPAILYKGIPREKEPLNIQDVDPNSIEPDLPIKYNVDRVAEVSVPGQVGPAPPVGILDGDPTKPPTVGVPLASSKDAVKDYTAFAEPNSTESRAYASLLLSAKAAERATLAQTAKRDVSLVKLFAAPDQYRSQVVHVEGSLRRLRKLDAPKALAEKGQTALYEGWIYPERDAPPCCVVFLELPKGLEPGEHLEKRIAFDAHFFKLLRYQGAQGARYAPLFLGRSIAVAAQPAQPPEGGKR